VFEWLVISSTTERIIDTQTQAQLFLTRGPHWPPGLAARFNQQDAGASSAFFMPISF
jgi:hypothetical protein